MYLFSWKQILMTIKHRKKHPLWLLFISLIISLFIDISCISCTRIYTQWETWLNKDIYQSLLFQSIPKIKDLDLYPLYCLPEHLDYKSLSLTYTNSLL